MKDLDLTTLRLFVAVCEEHSLTRAADRCALATSALSKRMSALEQHWGSALLRRKRSGMLPTPAGEILLQHARTLLQHAQRAQRDMSEHAQGVHGRVRVLASTTNFAQGLIADVARFLQLASSVNIRVDVEEAISPQIPRRVADGEAALGIAWDQVDMAELHTSAYTQDELAMVAPLGHPLTQRHSVRFADTLEWEQVGLPVTSLIYRITSQEAARAGKVWLPRVVLSNYEVAMRAVQAGLAIAVAPADIAREFANTHPVAVVALQDAWAKRQFVVCHHPWEQLNAATRALLDFLRQRASPAPPEADARSNHL